MEFHFTVTEGKMTFHHTVAIAWTNFRQSHEGWHGKIVEDKPPVSDEMRGYMFGAVIPFLKRIVPAWEPLSEEQVYEICKKNFNYFEAWNPVTKRTERYGQSTLSRSTTKEEAQQFIQEIAGWVAENYAMQLPDPEKYLRWKASAPLAGEIYNEDI
jgi:hypothetical protein